MSAHIHPKNLACLKLLCRLWCHDESLGFLCCNDINAPTSLDLAPLRNNLRHSCFTCWGHQANLLWKCLRTLCLRSCISESRPVTSQPGSCARFGSVAMATWVDGLGMAGSKIASSRRLNSAWCGWVFDLFLFQQDKTLVLPCRVQVCGRSDHSDTRCSDSLARTSQSNLSENTVSQIMHQRKQTSDKPARELCKIWFRGDGCISRWAGLVEFKDWKHSAATILIFSWVVSHCS